MILNSGYVFIVVPLIHKRFLPNENRHWYIQDTGFPFIASVVLAGVGRIFITNTMSKPVMILSIMAVSIISFGGAVMATSTTRSWLLNNLSKKKMRFELAGKNA